MSDLWMVCADSATTGAWVEPDDLRTLSGRSAWPELWWDVARGDFSELAAPLTFTVDRRGRLRDLLWNTGGYVKVASAHLLSVLTDVGATGWTSTPLHITYRNGEELPGYHLLAVWGECDSIYDNYDPATRWLDFDGWRARGIDVTVGWDGSDLFWTRAKASDTFIATDRVVRALRDADVTGLELTPSTEYEILLPDEVSSS